MQRNYLRKQGWQIVMDVQHQWSLEFSYLREVKLQQLTKLNREDRRHMACPLGPPAHTARPPRLSGRDTRTRTYSNGL
jgi:hypothetical protein